MAIRDILGHPNPKLSGAAFQIPFFWGGGAYSAPLNPQLYTIRSSCDTCFSRSRSTHYARFLSSLRLSQNHANFQEEKVQPTLMSALFLRAKNYILRNVLRNVYLFYILDHFKTIRFYLSHLKTYSRHLLMTNIAFQ